MVKKMEYRTRKDKDEGKLKTQAGFVTDIGTAGTLMTTICTTDLGASTPTLQRSSYVAKQLKDAKRNINRMKGQKQGT
jgi:hypothetical protein